MKLLNYTSSYFAILLLLAITLWAALFYINMLDEIYDSIDDSLENNKMLIMEKAASDPAVLQRTDFDEGNYAIHPIPQPEAENYQDVYLDTSMYMLNEEDYEPVRMLKTVFRQDGRFYELKVITSMVEEDDLMEDLFFALLWLYVGLIASILLLNNFLLKKVWSPFYHLLHVLKSFCLEQPEPFVPEKSRIEEFNTLNETVEKLLKSNMAAYQSQKQFIENASHELQTPVAISLNKLELLAEQANLSEEKLKLLSAAINNLERLTRLNKSLLLLSKIENRQFAEEETINLKLLCRSLVEDFADQAEFRGVELSLNEERDCIQKMNAGLAATLISNLIKNAIVHNHKGGKVDISLSSESLTVVNSGKREPLDENRLFARFYKGEASSETTGLGLSIVKAIADLYEFRMEYSYKDNHCIKIIF
jgi:signal transduction histidine kinase